MTETANDQERIVERTVEPPTSTEDLLAVIRELRKDLLTTKKALEFAQSIKPGRTWRILKSKRDINTQMGSPLMVPLPAEIWQHIIDSLPPAALIALGAVNHQLRDLAEINLRRRWLTKMEMTMFERIPAFKSLEEKTWAAAGLASRLTEMRLPTQLSRMKIFMRKLPHREVSGRMRWARADETYSQIQMKRSTISKWTTSWK